MFIEGLFLIVSMLIIWFNTEAFVKYSRLLHLPLVKVKEYLIAKEKNFNYFVELCKINYATKVTNGCFAPWMMYKI